MMNQEPNRSFRVGVLFGGRSGEHEVSLASARNVMEALEKAGHTVVAIGITPQGHWLTHGNPMAQLTGNTEDTDQALLPAESMPDHSQFPVEGQQRNGAYAHVNGSQAAIDATIDVQAATIAETNADSHAASAYNTWSLLPQSTNQEPLPAVDVIFPVLHGTYGEDGTVQGLLEMANLPYVGCGVLASAVAMDKVIAKQLFAQAGLRQADYQVVMRRRWQQQPATVLAALEQALPYPLFVKPANLGSSVGISKAHDRAELQAALDLASRYDRKLLVEAAVPNARELEVSVLGNDDPIVSMAGEVVPSHEFYDYESKYLDEASKLIIPAAIDDALLAQMQALAIKAFQAADCSGLARVDFLLDDERQELYLNEINTMPGFTASSMYPKLWAASGLSYPALVDRLLSLALERHADQLQNSTSRV